MLGKYTEKELREMEDGDKIGKFGRYKIWVVKHENGHVLMACIGYQRHLYARWKQISWNKIEMSKLGVTCREDHAGLQYCMYGRYRRHDEAIAVLLNLRHQLGVRIYDALDDRGTDDRLGILEPSRVRGSSRDKGAVRRDPQANTGGQGDSVGAEEEFSGVRADAVPESAGGSDGGVGA